MPNIQNASQYFKADHFVGVDEIERACALFKSSVNIVNIELSSFCNRRCDYCPVSQVDRISKSIPMDSTDLAKILNDLSSIEYDGMVNLNLYNEPTAERKTFLPRIREIRSILPRAEIVFSSNGDYLTNEYLDALEEIGVNKIFVTLHQKIGSTYSDVYSLNRLFEFSDRIKMRPKVDNFESNKMIHAYYVKRRLRIEVFTYNIKTGGTNRGELLDNVEVNQTRTSPCGRVFTDFTVSYDGSIFPCCQLFADSAQHQALRIGYIKDYPTIFHAYAARSFANWRRALLTHGCKSGVCATCMEGQYAASDEEIQSRNEIADKLLN